MSESLSGLFNRELLYTCIYTGADPGILEVGGGVPTEVKVIYKGRSGS